MRFTSDNQRKAMFAAINGKNSFSEDPRKDILIKTGKGGVAVYDRDFLEMMKEQPVKTKSTHKSIVEMIHEEGGEPDNMGKIMNEAKTPGYTSDPELRRIKGELLQYCKDTGEISDENEGRFAESMGYNINTVRQAGILIGKDALKPIDNNNFSLIPTSTRRVYGGGSSVAADKLKEEGRFIDIQNDMKIYEKDGKKYGITKGGSIIAMNSKMSNSNTLGVDTSLKAAKDAFDGIWDDASDCDTAEKQAVAFLEVLAKGENKEVSKWAVDELEDIAHMKKTEKDERNMEDLSFYTGDPDAGMSEREMRDSFSNKPSSNEYDNEQMAMGIAVEGEHKQTYEMIEDYYTKNKRMPPEVNVYQSIAEDHLRDEHPEYYTYLLDAEELMKKDLDD